MVWLRIDDGMMEHPKIVGLSHAAFRLHMRALCHCASGMTGGQFSSSAPQRSWGFTSRQVRELVEAGLWEPGPEGSHTYQIHDFLEYNPPPDRAAARREEISRVRREAGAKGARARWDRARLPMAKGRFAIANEWQTDSPDPDPIAAAAASDPDLAAAAGGSRGARWQNAWQNAGLSDAAGAVAKRIFELLSRSAAFDEKAAAQLIATLREYPPEQVREAVDGLEACGRWPWPAALRTELVAAYGRPRREVEPWPCPRCGVANAHQSPEEYQECKRRHLEALEREQEAG